MKYLPEKMMLEALSHLDRKLSKPLQLIIGGGGAIVLNHYFSLATTDIDAIPGSGTMIQEIDPLIKEVAKELGLAPDWLNPYFSTFTHVLPSDYGARLVQVGSFKFLEALTLSKEDLLIMKCFAGRMKDGVHARALVKAGANTAFVEKHLSFLQKKGIPGALEAIDFFDEVLE